MAGVNKVILLGRLGRDPEVRTFQNGNKVVNLRLATSERFKDRDGNQQERTEWHSVAIFNERLGDVAERFLRKGNEVYLEGQLETRKWTDKGGVDRYTTEIVLRQFRSELTLVGGNQRQQGEGDGGYGGGGSGRDSGAGSRQPDERRRRQTDNEYGSGSRDFKDDDIPF